MLRYFFLPHPEDGMSKALGGLCMEQGAETKCLVFKPYQGAEYINNRLLLEAVCCLPVLWDVEGSY